jgi:hypothetical protein
MASTPPRRADSTWRSVLLPTERLIWLCFFVAVATLALRHASRDRFVLLWDDALFFKRVAYNIVRHGVAGWNQSDGPVFVNTSQLFQLIAAGLVWLFPHHYNAAVTYWGALALAASFPILLAATRAPAAGALLLFCLLEAPPVFLSITTGMETPTVFLVLAAFLYALLRAETPPLALAALQWLVYLVRPDAILLSLGAATLALHGRVGPKQALKHAAWALLGIALISTAFWAYYGTAVPLSTFLKVSPISTYDHDYLSLDTGNKQKNLAQIGLLLLPLAPLIARRRDRVTFALCAPGALFIGFHGLTTYEVAAYHARFYAPALPFFFAAALRGVEGLDARRERLRVAAFGALAALALLVAYRFGWVETGRDFEAGAVSLAEYARYAVGVPLLGASALAFGRERRAEGRLLAPLAGAMALLQVATTFPRSPLPASDEVSNLRTIERHAADVGIDVVQRCFEQPLLLTHSEIGLPGVMFLESRIIDFTGLANPKMIDGSFDFEQMCRAERPEIIFRPHWSHRALNRTLDASACLREGYELAPLPRPSTCPLLVRKDLFPRYLACSQAGR